MKKIIQKLRGSVAFKILVGIVVLLVVYSAIVSWIGYRNFTQALLGQYSDDAFLIAQSAANVIDPDMMEIYAEDGPDGGIYQEKLSQLDEICNSTGATFVYVIQPDLTDYAHITFLFSTMNAEAPYTKYEFGYVRETTNDEYREKYRALYEGEADQELVIRDQGYISTDPHITAMVAIRDADGRTKGILCVQRQMDVLAKARRTYIRRIFLALIILVAFVIFGQLAYLHRMLLNPVMKITDEAKRFANENKMSGKKLKDSIRNKDEIGQLAQSVDTMEEQIVSYVDNLTRATAEKERMVTELSLAARIQLSMLPNEFPPFPERTEFDLHAIMDPAREVGGDFYDFFLVDEDHLCLMIADVSGKGIPAALFMMAARILLKDNAMLGRRPSQILETVNTAICDNNPEEMFVTVWLGILEISTGKLTAANAGHEYPILQEPGGMFEQVKDRHGFVVGGMDGVHYTEYELPLTPGSKLFLYTDGVPEAANEAQEMFGMERILTALNSISSGSPKEILVQMEKRVMEYAGKAPQFDDLTMLCLSYHGKN